MIGFKINNGFVDIANTKFSCPHCKKRYNDDNDIYLNRCHKNKQHYCTITCDCGERFGMTYDTQSDAVGFKLKKDNG
jgi:hypothetical protein